MVDNCHSLINSYLLLHRLALFLPDFIQGSYHVIIIMHITKCAVHVHQKFRDGNVPTIFQGMHPPTRVSLQIGIHVRHQALFLVFVQPSLHVKHPKGICHICIWICGMSKHMGVRHFSFCLLLLQCLLLSASLTVECPSESAPLSGEEGGEFPGHFFAGRDLGGLPHR